jgi:hypothetical protein
MGFFSAISRILKATVVGALMLPRIDHSVMPDGFQRFDQGSIHKRTFLENLLVSS